MLGVVPKPKRKNTPLSPLPPIKLTLVSFCPRDNPQGIVKWKRSGVNPDSFWEINKPKTNSSPQKRFCRREGSESGKAKVGGKGTQSRLGSVVEGRSKRRRLHLHLHVRLRLLQAGDPEFAPGARQFPIVGGREKDVYRLLSRLDSHPGFQGPHIHVPRVLRLLLSRARGSFAKGARPWLWVQGKDGRKS